MTRYIKYYLDIIHPKLLISGGWAEGQSNVFWPESGVPRGLSNRNISMICGKVLNYHIPGTNFTSIDFRHMVCTHTFLTLSKESAHKKAQILEAMAITQNHSVNVIMKYYVDLNTKEKEVMEFIEFMGQPELEEHVKQQIIVEASNDNISIFNNDENLVIKKNNSTKKYEGLLDYLCPRGRRKVINSRARNIENILVKLLKSKRLLQASEDLKYLNI
eukprot:TRINITY_DN1541_c0_g1_i1.p1 TRINITY_DN1541_c0_g1~~TRINITY_DN1541_c0_g1_i1.p1  ORF type:complete len:217 (+),score=32.56 TRINITY_DN1541_c0_g1_i1:436-1086(+)